MTEPVPLSRREALKRVAALAAALAALEMPAFAATPGRGYGPDPALTKKEIPWPRVLTPEEKRAVTALADIIIPADEYGPAASAVGVPDFMDEWVSAPYDQQQRELEVIRKGLTWLDTEARKRTGNPYAEATAAEQTALLEDIIKEGTEANKEAFSFFKLFRDRTAGGYYTTPEGWKAIGYVGNVPQMEFAGPPAEVLKHLGLL
jgi:hypothetical protein